MACWKEEIHENIKAMAAYLLGCQVIAKDLELPLEDGASEVVTYCFLRRDPGPYPVELKREGENLWLRERAAEDWIGPFEPDSFVRFFPGKGIRRPASGAGGITFLYQGIQGGKVSLQAFDRGGIWEELPNMEAFLYEPQVAATFYADAYAAYTFAWLAIRDGADPVYLEAAAITLDFIMRIYPRYEPMIMDGLTHSDFKNPAYIETVEELMAEVAPRAALESWRSLYPLMVNDEAYSPTNVHALRYHWWSVRDYYTDRSGNVPGEFVERVIRDRTGDGLIHDNNYSELSFGGHTDAHDLTYHLYTLACLVRGYHYRPLPEVLELILNGAAFSLSLTTSAGELSYLGRGANNLYHMASAVYVFLYSASHDQEKAGRYRRAARLIHGYLASFRLPEGNIPTALNEYPQERMGWNHCHTPYDALACYLLINALPLVDEKASEEGLALEKGARLYYPDARYAAYSNEHFYAIFFGGNELSYPWSGCHKTGVAGLAHLGLQGLRGLLPVLEQSLREEEWSTSDLPDILLPDGTTAVPAGLGELRPEGDDFVLELAYGGFRMVQRYRFKDRGIEILCTITCQKGGHYRLVGWPSLSVRLDQGWSHTLKEGELRAGGPPGHLVLSVVDCQLPGNWVRYEPSTTARGWHQKVARVVEKEFIPGEVHRCNWLLEISN